MDLFIYYESFRVFGLLWKSPIGYRHRHINYLYTSDSSAAAARYGIRFSIMPYA